MFGSKLCLLAAFAWPVFGSVIIPLSQQGAGNGYASDDIPNYSGNAICYIGYSQGNPSCSISIASNQPTWYLSPYTGTSSSSVSAYTDSSGAHFTASGSGSGSSEEEVNADTSFGDTAINNSSTAVQFQATFHFDAELYSLSDASDQVTLTFFRQYNGTTIFTQSLKLGGGGTTDFINQTITTPMETVAAHSSLLWSIDLNGHMVVSSDPTLIYPAGLPQGFIDAGNTLSMVGLSVFDMAGNPLPESALTSLNGYDYTGASATPEPASLALSCGAAVLLAIFRRRIGGRRGGAIEGLRAKD